MMRASRFVVLPAWSDSTFVTVVWSDFSPSTVSIEVNASFTDARSSSARDLLARVRSTISPRISAPVTAMTEPSGALSGCISFPSILSPTLLVLVWIGVISSMSNEVPVGTDTVLDSEAGTTVDLGVVDLGFVEAFFTGAGAGSGFEAT
jgi:hypothetical protein